MLKEYYLENEVILNLIIIKKKENSINSINKNKSNTITILIIMIKYINVVTIKIRQTI